MKVLKWILIVLVSLIVLIILAGLLMPRKLEVSASTDIDLPRTQVFYALASYSDRQAWDPWLEMEPGAAVTINSNTDYIGSTYEWSGEKLGNGKMQVDSVMFPSFIKSSIWFRPDMDPSAVYWKLEETESGTMANWSLVSESGNPFTKLINQLMKSSLRKSFETGLSNLKTHLETNGVSMSKLSNMEVKEYPAMKAVVAEASNASMEVMSQTMEMLFGMVMQAISENGLTPAGMPFAYYFNYNPETGTTSIKAGVPVAAYAKVDGPARYEELKSFTGFSAIHTGPYTEFESSYQKIMEEMGKRGLAPAMESWEFYHTDPGMEQDESKWVTEIVFVTNKSN